MPDILHKLGVVLCVDSPGGNNYDEAHIVFVAEREKPDVLHSEQTVTI